MPNPRMDVMKQRRAAMQNLGAVVLSDVPANLPEVQQLRLKLSMARALTLAMENALTSLREREIPRSMRSGDPNAYLTHVESLRLTDSALALIAQAKQVI